MSHNKNDYELYLLSRKYAGEILTSKEAMKKFGYSKSTYICDTVLMKYLKQITKYGTRPKLFMVKDLVALDDGTIDNKLNKKSVEYRENRVSGFRRIMKTDLYLLPRCVVPFWLLKEFGGKII